MAQRRRDPVSSTQAAICGVEARHPLFLRRPHLPDAFDPCCLLRSFFALNDEGVVRSYVDSILSQKPPEPSISSVLAV